VGGQKIDVGGLQVRKKLAARTGKLLHNRSLSLLRFRFTTGRVKKETSSVEDMFSVLEIKRHEVERGKLIPGLYN